MAKFIVSVSPDQEQDENGFPSYIPGMQVYIEAETKELASSRVISFLKDHGIKAITKFTMYKYMEEYEHVER